MSAQPCRKLCESKTSESTLRRSRSTNRWQHTRTLRRITRYSFRLRGLRRWQSPRNTIGSWQRSWSLISAWFKGGLVELGCLGSKRLWNEEIHEQRLKQHAAYSENKWKMSVQVSVSFSYAEIMRFNSLLPKTLVQNFQGPTLYVLCSTRNNCRCVASLNILRK